MMKAPEDTAHTPPQWVAPPKQSSATVCNRVRALREAREISCKELAAILGINHRTLGYIERGEYRIKMDLAYRIANFFELPLPEVFCPEPMNRSTHILGPQQHDRNGGADG